MEGSIGGGLGSLFGNDLLGDLPKDSLTQLDDNTVLLQSDGDLAKKKICSQNDGTRIFEIYKDIASHHQGTLSITSYYTKLNTFWDELASYNDLPHFSCGAMEREKVMQFLIGLNESYSPLCGKILLMDPFPTVEKAYSLVLANSDMDASNSQISGCC